MNKKLFLTGMLAMSLMISGFGQKCVKFIDYQNKTIDTKGISMKLFGETIGAGATSVTPVYRDASDKLKQLDLLQYSICGQLTKIKNDFVRESLQSKYTSILMNIMQLADGQGATPVPVEVPEPGKQITSATKPVVSEGMVTPDENGNITPAPSPQPAPVNNNVWTDLPEMPCYGDAYNSTETAIRATSMGESMDMQTAKRMARTAALEELAAKIEVTVKALTVDYTLSQKKNLTESLEQKFENRTETSVNRTLSGTKTICEKFRQKGNTYQCLLALEISKEDIVRGVYDTLKQDSTLPVDNYNNFKKEFDKVMETYEENQ